MHIEQQVPELGPKRKQLKDFRCNFEQFIKSITKEIDLEEEKTVVQEGTNKIQGIEIDKCMEQMLISLRIKEENIHPFYLNLTTEVLKHAAIKVIENVKILLPEDPKREFWKSNIGDLQIERYTDVIISGLTNSERTQKQRTIDILSPKRERRSEQALKDLLEALGTNILSPDRGSRASRGDQALNDHSEALDINLNIQI